MSERINRRIEELFEICLRSQGELYLKAERALVSAGTDAFLFLQEQAATAADPFARVLASVLAVWVKSGGEVFERALAYIDLVEKNAARSILRTPRADSLAAALDKLFNAAVVEFLSVRLVKQPDWPQWKVAAILQYLAIEKDALTLAPLVRFASEKENRRYGQMVELTLKPFPAEDVGKAWQAEARYRGNPNPDDDPRKTSRAG